MPYNRQRCDPQAQQLGPYPANRPACAPHPCVGEALPVTHRPVTPARGRTRRARAPWFCTRDEQRPSATRELPTARAPSVKVGKLRCRLHRKLQRGLQENQAVVCLTFQVWRQLLEVLVDPPRVFVT